MRILKSKRTDNTIPKRKKPKEPKKKHYRENKRSSNTNPLKGMS